MLYLFQCSTLFPLNPVALQCAACLAVDQHDATHAFIKFDRPVDLPLFKELTGLATEQPSPLINFTFY
jgi:hypothetical protein